MSVLRANSVSLPRRRSIETEFSDVAIAAHLCNKIRPSLDVFSRWVASITVTEAGIAARGAHEAREEPCIIGGAL